MLACTILQSLWLFTLFLFSQASPRPLSSLALAGSLEERTVPPYFPPQPPSCPICANSWPSIDSCADACPVLANFSTIIFNPGAFIDIIKCACADTFQAAFPQCVDCFIQTNQSDVIDSNNLPAVLDGMRRICAIESALLGGAVTANGQVTPAGTTVQPKPTATNEAHVRSAFGIGAVLTLSLLGIGSLVL